MKFQLPQTNRFCYHLGMSVSELAYRFGPFLAQAFSFLNDQQPMLDGRDLSPGTAVFPGDRRPGGRLATAPARELGGRETLTVHVSVCN